MTDFTSSSSRRKVPPLDPEDFASWEMLFKNYCGYEEWDLFYEYAPEIDEDELDRLRTPEGDDTEESRRYEKSIRNDLKKWKKNSDKIRQNLVEALCENPQTKLMALEFQDLPTGEFYDAVKKRYKDTSSQSLHFHTGILNQMTCTASDTRMDFANRLVAQFLVVMSLDGEMSEAGRCERLLNGLKANPKYRMEANLMELLPNQTWDSITNNLRQYDRADMNLKKENANAATTVITCYGCGQTGHKRPDCPNREKGKGNGRGRGNGGGKGSGKGFSGGRGRNRGNKGGGRGGGQKGGKSHFDLRTCNLCNKTGHLSNTCPYAKEFQQVLAKRNNSDSSGYVPKRRKEYEDDEYSNWYCVSVRRGSIETMESTRATRGSAWSACTQS